jgi:signal transduction histidine kinase
MNDAGPESAEMRVLVLAVTPKDLVLTRDVLSRAGIDSLGCSSLDELTNRLARGAGAVLIPEDAVGTVDNSLARSLAQQPSWSDLPILVLARPGADSAAVSTAMDRYGNVTVLERPMRIAALVSAVRSALRARARQYQVRDDARALQDARDRLEERVRERTAELSAANALLEQKMQETEAAERRAHRLLRELVAAEETERGRISRDLHDELGQQLTSLRLHLSELERELSPGSKARHALAASVHEAAKIDSRVSFLAWTIRPTTIEELGLVEALRGYVNEWSRNFDIAADFRASSVPATRLRPEIEINVYRIAQECLNNIAKHAKADVVSVLLNIDEKDVSLIVEDDGTGFDTSVEHPATSDGGLGIRGMQERTELLSGTFQIESGITGTTVYVRIPAKYRSRKKASSA